ncbi:TonB-dependent receptor [Novosphingobium sp. JCM 18896]|uniref:TonB-dependent receptor n=1 Tax=Novosphingobium sp. JCM 18896 TaxID=2989731 RepID=UPI002223095A|nr:TonB-dependent receptor [Novosphingobium sp. JCM 18896]MCW1432283.1 TonB-dependent receptor [Novosphingobium sp. JCM 18896]
MSRTVLNLDTFESDSPDARKVALSIIQCAARARSLAISSTSVLALSCMALPSVAIAQDSSTTSPSPALTDNTPTQDTGEIVVTAQKRSEAASDVPMSITAATGDQLTRLGIRDTGDLAKLVPGFAAAESGVGTPVYFLRGIGLFESSLAAKPTVGLYIDEQPIPFPALSLGTAFDLERVEVLKGPQGTLFGQNATGGAVNYIAAKPTDTFKGGFNASVGRFGWGDVSAFLSGPISTTLNARIAVKHDFGGDWQRSYTRDEGLGSRNFTQGRLLLDWNPADRLKVSLNVNGFINKSDTQAAQLVTVFQVRPAIPPIPALRAYPVSPETPRAADWSNFIPQKRDDWMWQGNLRADFDLTDDITFTSLSSYSKYKQAYGQDTDGTSLQVFDYFTTGHVESFNQELRLNGRIGEKGTWLIGGNYSKDDTDERTDQYYGDQTSARVFSLVQPGPAGRVLTAPELQILSSIGASVLPDGRVSLPAGNLVPIKADTDFETYAAFANADYEILPGVKIQGGIRYTKTKVNFAGCAINAGNQVFTTGTLLGNGQLVGSVPVEGCATFDANNRPVLAVKQLDEDNVSWRAGIDWKIAPGRLVYANVSRGYKAGGFPLISANREVQFTPVTQESVTAYEAGFKLEVIRNVRLDGAAFYYDYKDKQLKGSRVVPVFGALEGLVNIPKSRVQGFELQLIARPLAGLTINAGGTHISSKVTQSYQNFTPFGAVVDFKGLDFPYTPKWQGNFDAEYRFAVGASLEAFVGSTVTARSGTRGVFPRGPYTVSAVSPTLPSSAFAIPGFTLLDLRAGIGNAENGWSLSIYGRNVTNKYYLVFAGRRGDQVVRKTGMPATYGASVSYRF